MPESSVWQSKAYLQCLSLHAFIFKKPGQLTAIAHKGKDKYYQALLSCKDLSKIAAETLTLGDKVGENLKDEDLVCSFKYVMSS